MKLKSLAICALALLSVLPLAAKGKRQVGIVAHRGFWLCEAGGNSHNSIASLKAAQDGGFWGSEFDVNMTKDGVLMVFHDDAVAGMKFIEHNAAEFAEVRLPNGEKIPTLDEYLSQFEKNKKCRVVFELKFHPYELEETAVDKSIECLKAHGLFDPKQTIFISFSMHECMLFAQKCPGFTVQFLGSDPDPDVTFANGVNGVDTYFGTLYQKTDWYSKARANGMSVNVWTVDNKEDMRKMIEMGVDYITTNKPDVLRQLLKEMKIKELKAGKNFKTPKKK